MTVMVAGCPIAGAGATAPRARPSGAGRTRPLNSESDLMWSLLVPDVDPVLDGMSQDRCSSPGRETLPASEEDGWGSAARRIVAPSRRSLRRVSARDRVA